MFGEVGGTQQVVETRNIMEDARSLRSEFSFFVSTIYGTTLSRLGLTEGDSPVGRGLKTA